MLRLLALVPTQFLYFLAVILTSLISARLILPEAPSWLVSISLFLQVLASILSAHKCISHLIVDRDNFEEVQKTYRLATKSHEVVRSLIPSNVMTKLRNRENSEDFLGAPISKCTMMFCSLEPKELFRSRSSSETFELLDQLFEKFDDAVEEFGMHKYQHVGDWYIITCPRAAAPFDQEEQARPYPDGYYESMVLLAVRLMQIAAQHYIDGQQVGLKIGLHCGPAAGAVIGMIRTFYCVYGDTTNTAARMCKHASFNQILCTETFAESIRRTGTRRVQVNDIGQIKVKGKGLMKVCSLAHMDWSSSCSQPDIESFDSCSSSDTCPYDDENLSSLMQWKPFEQQHLSPSPSPSQSHTKVECIWEVLADPLSIFQLNLHQTEDHVLCLSIGLLLHKALLVTHLMTFSRPSDKLQAEEKSFVDTIRICSITLHSLFVAVYYMFFRTFFWRDQPSHSKIHEICIIVFMIVFTLFSSGYLGGKQDIGAAVFSLTLFAVNSVYLRIPPKLVIGLMTLVMLVSVLMQLSDLRSYWKYTSWTALFGTIVLTLWKSKDLDYGSDERSKFYKSVHSELVRMKEILSDLIPVNIANQMVKGNVKMPCVMKRAVVLQLDICNFTALSQKVDSLEVAAMIHRLFSEFDRAVLKFSLFKIDTIGDAYIVAGWLPCENDWFAQPKTRTACKSMLALSHKMLDAVSAHSLQGGPTLQCRIGISVGIVASGVLGRRQSRFHVVGQTMQEVDSLEQTAGINTVHVSDKFIQGLGHLHDIGEGRAKTEATRRRSSLIEKDLLERMKGSTLLWRSRRKSSLVESKVGEDDLPGWHCVCSHEAGSDVKLGCPSSLKDGGMITRSKSLEQQMRSSFVLVPCENG